MHGERQWPLVRFLEEGIAVPCTPCMTSPSTTTETHDAVLDAAPATAELLLV